MTIYIKGIEMPKDKPLVIYPDRTVANMYDVQRGTAVFVPPHGRLIDASESIRVEFYDEEHEEWTRHEMTIDELLSQSWVDADAPTIIPAEE